MKVTLTKEIKENLYTYELPQAKRVIEIAKEDEYTPKNYAEIAIDILYPKAHINEIIKAEAHISPHTKHPISDDTGNIGIYIKFYANIIKNGNMIIWGQIGLTELWEIWDKEELTEDEKISIKKRSIIEYKYK